GPDEEADRGTGAGISAAGESAAVLLVGENAGVARPGRCDRARAARQGLPGLPRHAPGVGLQAGGPAGAHAALGWWTGRNRRFTGPDDPARAPGRRAGTSRAQALRG